MDARKLGLLVDLLTVCVVFLLTYVSITVYKGHRIFLDNEPEFLATYLFIFVSWLLSLVLFAEYPSRRVADIGKEIFVSLRVNFFGLMFFALLAFLFKVDTFSRMFLGIFCGTSIAAMIANRSVFRLLLYTFRRFGWNLKSRIIVGSGPAARQYYMEVMQNQGFGLKILGYLSDGETIPDVPCLGTIQEMEQVLIHHPVDGVILALSISDPAAEMAIQACETQGIPVELLLNGLSSRLVHSSLINTGGMPRLVLDAIPHSIGSIILKRVTDIVLSGLALIALSPVFLTVAVLIKLDDRGPVFFGQERVGIHKRMFKIYKFRSMRTDAEKIKAELMHLNEMSGPVFKMKDDPRVTRVGKFLRKTSLDELPQLWNVFIGHMSLVGPRPPIPAEVAQYDHAHRRRLSVKPGITCLWQISGRNNIDFEGWMDLDLQYIDNWSYADDLKILLKTVPAVLRGSGAS